MASLVKHGLGRVASTPSSATSTSSSRSGKSFGNWTRRPRDSLEKTRQRVTAVSQISCRNWSLARNVLIQENDEEEETQSVVLPILRPPISRNTVRERYPRGRASALVFALNVIAIYAYGAAISGIVDIFSIQQEELYHSLSKSEQDAMQFMKLLFQYCISRVFYPFTGFIADVYIGRWRMIHISFLLLLTGYVMIVISFAIEGQSGIHLNLFVSNSIKIAAFLFISVGGAAFEATIIPFGVDQLQGASSAEISSYFYFFYFSRNLGLWSGIVISCVLSYATLDTTQIIKLYSVFGPLVTTMVLTVGIILMVCLHHWFFKNTLWENPVRLIARVLCYAATVKRHLPVRNRAFRYGEERKRRIELAKITFDGKFHDEKVEDVKAFCSIFLLLLSLMPTLFSINAFDVLISRETNQTLVKLNPSKYLKADLYPNLYWGVNSPLVLIVLPVVNFLVIPCFPKLTIRARIGIGLLLYLVGNIAMVVIHAAPLATHATVTGVQLGCMLIPVTIFAIAEVLTVVSVLEFIYAQSPESMKGLLTGLYYFFLGLTSIVSSAMYYLYKDNLDQNKVLLPFYTAFTIIQVVGVVFYMVAAAFYKNRLRHDEDSLQERLIIENRLQSNIAA